jgi:hypothetical protein
LPCRAARTLNCFSRTVSMVVLKRLFPGDFVIASTFWCIGENMPGQIANLMPKSQKMERWSNGVMGGKVSGVLEDWNVGIVE